MGCLGRELLLQETLKFPVKLVKLFESETGRRQLRATRPCLLDQFFQSLLSQFPGDLLNSPEARCTVAMFAGQTPTDIVQIEWSHGRVHRLLKAQSAQTKEPSLDFINAQTYCMKVKQRHAGLCSSEDRTMIVPVPDKEAATDEKQTTLKRPGGGGGAWRAFTSLRSRGSGEKPNFQALAEAYQEAKRSLSEEYQLALSMGRAATFLHRAEEGPTNTGRSSFGTFTRQVRRRLGQQAEAHSTPEPGVLQLPGIQLHIESEQPYQVSLKHSTDLELSKLRSMLARQGRDKAKRQRQRQDVLDSWVQQLQGPALGHLQIALPELDAHLADLHMRPSSGFLSFDVAPNNLDPARKVAAWAFQNSRKSNISSVLQQQWGTLNTPVEPAQLKPGGARESALPPLRGKCCDDGMCTCSPAGRKISNFRDRLLALLKRHLPRSNDEIKALMMQGHFCILLQSDANVQKPALDLQEMFADMEVSSDSEDHATSEAMTGELWLHLGLMCLKPYRPTWQRLQKKDETAGRVRLQQTGEFETTLSVLAKLSLERTWSVSFWQLLNRKTPVDALDPRLCVVTHFASESTPVWPPPPRKKRARAERGAPGRGQTGPTSSNAPRSSSRV